MSDPADPEEFEVIVHPLDDGSYWAEVVGLPGCLTQANSYTGILARVRDAHDACLAASPPALSAGGGGFRANVLREARTAGALAESLATAGWQVAASGSFHHVYAIFGRDDRISVPSDPETLLNDGYRRALEKLFA